MCVYIYIYIYIYMYIYMYISIIYLYYIYSIFTKSVDSNFRAFWLAPVTRNILGYSLFCQQKEKSSKPWSSQFWTQFKQLRTEAWKSQDFNGLLKLSDSPVPGVVGDSVIAVVIGWVEGISGPTWTNCDDHGLLDFKSAVQYMKHFIYHFRKKNDASFRKSFRRRN